MLGALAWLGSGVGQLAQRLVGTSDGSMWRALWTRAQMDGTSLPAQSPELSFPLGAPLASPGPLTDVLGSALSGPLGPVLAHNLLLLVALPLAAAGAALLARSQDLSRSTSTATGLAFALSTPLLSALASSTPEVLSLGLLPWVVLGIERLARQPGPGPLALSLAAFLGCLAADLNQLVLLLILLPIPLLGAPRQPLKALPWTLGLVVLGGLAAAALTLPALADLRAAGPYSPPTALQLWGPAGPESGALRGVATMTSLVRPGATQLAGGMERELSSSYLGWTLLGLALVGCSLKTKRWSLLAVAAAVVALGPWVPVEVGAERTSPAAWWLAAWKAWPLSRGLDLPGRALPTAVLALTVLAGLGLERLRGLLPWPRLRPLLLPVATLGLLLEPLLLSGLGWPLPQTEPPSTAHVAVFQGSGAVLDWPHSVHGREYGQDLYLQLEHGRPIPWDLSEADGPNGIESNGLLRLLEASTRGEPLPLNEARRGAWVLQQQGVGWLVLHASRLGDSDAHAAQSLLAELLPLEAELADGTRVYRMSP